MSESHDHIHPAMRPIVNAIAPANPNAPVPGHSLAEMVMTSAMLEAEILQFAEQNLGEVNEGLETFLKTMETQIERKVDSVKFVMERLAMSSELMSVQAAKYQRAARALDEAEARLKDRVKFIMQSSGKDELKGANWKFKLAKAQARTEINMETLPKEYTKQVTTVEVDKEKLKADLKTGMEIPGVTQTPSFSLRSFVNKGD